MNGLIMENHCARIGETLFKRCLYIQKPMHICNLLILELLKRWLSVSHSFRLMQHSIPLTTGDTCLGLGLGVGGVEAQFDTNVCGLVGSVMIEMMKCMIESNVDDVENFCHLYILVCFVVLYIPSNSKTVCNILCSFLYNLYSLSKYNWAKVVHSYLVNNLSLGLFVLDRDILFSRILSWSNV